MGIKVWDFLDCATFLNIILLPFLTKQLLLQTKKSLYATFNNNVKLNLNENKMRSIEYMSFSTSVLYNNLPFKTL